MTSENEITNDIKSTFARGENSLKDALCEAEKRMKEGNEQVTKWASGVDKQAHENPWPLVTGVGVGCLLLGIILGKSKG